MKQIGSRFSTRRRFTFQQRATLLNQYHRSDLTQRAFVQVHGLSLATLSKWLREERQTGVKTFQRKGSNLFQAVNLSPMFGTASWAAEIALSDGAVLRLNAQADPVWAAELLHALRRPC